MPGLVDLLHFGFDGGDGGLALSAAAHQDDALDDVVIRILARDSQSWLVPDFDFCDVP